MEIKCREGGIGIVGWSNYEYYYPYELLFSRPPVLDEEWMKKLEEFHGSYFGNAEFDVPLAYIVFRDGNDNVVKIVAVSLYTGDFGPSIDLIDVEEWLRSRDDP